MSAGLASAMSVVYLERLAERHPHFYYRRDRLLRRSLHYRPTAERVSKGFQRFECDVFGFADDFQRLDFRAMLALPTVRNRREPDVRQVLLHLWYAESGAVIVAQPSMYVNQAFNAILPPLLLEGAMARAHIDVVKQLDGMRRHLPRSEPHQGVSTSGVPIGRGVRAS